MQNPHLVDETPEEYAERMRQIAAMMALPVGRHERGRVMLAYNTYATFAAELGAYNPRRFSQEVHPAAAAATVGATHQWFVTADLTEEEYLERIYRPWRARVKAGQA